MMLAMVARSSGIRGDYRTGHNCERNQGKQDLTEHLHNDLPQENQAGRSIVRAVRYNAA